MNSALGTVTSVALIASCFLGYKNKEAYAYEIDARQKMQATLAATKKTLSQTQATLASTSKERKETQDAVTALKSDIDGQTKMNAELAQDLTAKTEKVTAGKTQLDEVRQKLEGVGEINTLASKIRELKSELSDQEQKIAGEESNLASLNANDKSLNNTIKVQNEISSRIASKTSSPNLKTSIKSIYPTWGFVTLGGGNRAGVVMNSNLNVVRDGAVVAKLVVTSVEANTASATIVPESVEDQGALMVGDSVVAAQK